MKRTAFFAGLMAFFPTASGASSSVPLIKAFLGENQETFKKLEPKLKAMGLMDRKATVESDIAELDRIETKKEEKEASRAAKIDAGKSPAGASKATAKAVRQAETLAGAKTKEVAEVDSKEIEAFDPETGKPVEKTEEDIIAERIDLIVAEKVHTSVAEPAYRSLLWAGYFMSKKLAKGDKVQSPKEVSDLWDMLGRQLDEKVMGADLWNVYYDDKMPSGILATYNGVVKVGPSYRGMPSGGPGQLSVVFHEWMHGIDDDVTGINENRFGAGNPDGIPYGDESAKTHGPRYRAATEFLAYTDMKHWADGF